MILSVFCFLVMAQLVYSGIPATIRTFRYDEVVSFCEVRKTWGGFSNMSSEYPLLYNGVIYPTAEHLYLAGRFSAHPEIVAMILTHRNAMYCKRLFHGRAWVPLIRPDWAELQLPWMRYVLNLKYEQHPSFRRLLQQTAGKVILEDSTMLVGTNPLCGHSSFFWGAKDLTRREVIRNERRRITREARLEGWSQARLKLAREDARERIGKRVRGEFVGANVLGLLLTELRDSGHLECSIPEDMLRLNCAIAA